jgi:hypothetical protein
MNKNQGSEKDMQQRGQGALSTPEKGEEQETALHMNFQ